VMLAGLGLGLPLITGDPAYAVDPAATRTVCAPGTPAVCGTAVHEDGVLKAAVPARQVLTALKRLPDPPTRAIETESWTDLADFAYPVTMVGPDTIGLGPLSTDEARAQTPDEMAITFANGLGVSIDRCDRLLAGMSEEARGKRTNGIWDARSLAGAWLLNRSTTDTEDPALAQTLQTFKALPEAEQVRRMTLARKAFIDCTPGSLELLTAPRKTS